MKIPAITVDDVCLKYRGRWRLRVKQRKSVEVLKHIGFELFQGETLGLVGRNGAGKTTLLRLIADIISPDSGTIERYGNRVHLLGLQIGFQEGLSGYENALLGGMLLGYSRKEAQALLPEIVRYSELDYAIHDPFRTYSSGMKARLAFAVAINFRSDVLLVDELMGVGDAAFQRRSGNSLKRIIDSDRSVIVVSHSPGTIKELCDRAIWIEKGIVECSGDPESVLNAYHARVQSEADSSEEKFRLAKNTSDEDIHLS